MELRKVVRLTGVLLASQLRAGRAGSDPRGFFGRPIAIAVADCAAFSVVFVLTALGAVAFANARPDAFAAVLPAVLPFVPLLGVAAVLVGGLMFELASTAKFATSDAVNWLPLTSTEFVVASSLSLTALYSLSIAVLAGVALGLGVVAGALPVAAFAVALGVVGLFEGALLIEILRAVTQRTGSLGRRRGSAGLVVRAAAFLLVLLAFELLFNPVILLSVVKSVGDLGPVAVAVPFLWSSDAVSAAWSGDFVGAALAVAADAVLVGATAYVAARARSRFWVPTGGEVEFEPHRYGTERSRWQVLGLGRAESALVTKDLRGLVRRRELLPVLLVPFVIAIVLVLQRGGQAGPGAEFVTLGVLAWVGGLSALILAASSFGQERRAVVHLYYLPIRPAAVLKAKAVAGLVVSGPIAAAIVTIGLALQPPPLSAIPGVALAAALAVAEGVAIGLLVSTRYSDFQDRPRPQFVRPIPMLGASAIYAVLGGTSVAVGLSLAGGLPILSSPLAVLVTGTLVGTSLAAVVLGTSRGALRLLRESPL